MQSARATWTDERLDDLAKRLDLGFEKVDRDIRELRAEVRSGHQEVRSEINALRTEMRAGDEALSAEVATRFGELDRTVRRFGFLMISLLAAALLEGRF